MTLIALCLWGAYGVSRQEWRGDGGQVDLNQMAENEPLGTAYELSLSQQWPGVLGRSTDGRLSLFSTNAGQAKISLVKTPLPLITDVGRLVGDGKSLPVYLSPKPGITFQMDSSVNQYYRKFNTPSDHTVTAACLLNEGRHLVVCTIDENQSLEQDKTISQVRWFDLEQNVVLYEYQLEDLIFDVVHDELTSTIYMASRAGIISNHLGTADTYEISNYATRSLQISTEHRMLISGHFNGEITGFNLDTGAESWMVFAGRSSTIKSMAIAPDNPRLVAVSGELGHVLLLDTVTGRLINKLEQSAPATNGIAFAREGGQLIVSLCDSRIVVWDLHKRQIVQTWLL